MTASLFRLNPALDPERLAADYRRRGRVQVADFVDPAGAETLRQSLRADRRWQLVINQGGKLFKLDRSAFAELADADRDKIMAAVHAAARHGFQYCYESIAVPDSGSARGRRDSTRRVRRIPVVGTPCWLCSGWSPARPT